MFKHTVVAFLALVVVQIYGQATITCTYTDPSTQYKYDLTPLVSNNADYIVDVPTGTDAQTVTGYRITLNVCRPILLQACAAQAGANCDACQQWPLEPPGQFAHNAALGSTTATTIGKAQDTSGADSEGVTMYFGGFQGTVTVNFVCNPNAGAGRPVYIGKPTSTQFLLQWKSAYACATNGNATNDPTNETAVITAVQNYANYLNTEQCELWAGLFAPDGIKYDDPAPIIGYNALVSFCQSTFKDFTSFTYTLVGPVLVTNSDGYKAHMQWMLGGTEAGGIAYAQIGYGSFVFNDQMLIESEIGFNLQDSSYPTSTTARTPIVVL